MGFPELDVASVARTLELWVGSEAELADTFFERHERVEVAFGGDAPEAPTGRLRREEGLAVRLTTPSHSWLASRDGVDQDRFRSALRQVARQSPRRSPKGEDRLALGSWPESVPWQPLLELHGRLEAKLRQRRVAFPYRLQIERHRRWIQVVGPRLVPEDQEESFLSLSAAMPWGRYGTLLNDLGDNAVDTVADRLVELFRSRDAPPPTPGPAPVLVLAPEATAVLLHEAVAHSLEVDTLALTGRPESALGLQLAPTLINLLDDPTSAPEGVRRESDDEGMGVQRRWLLRDGVVEQLLADRRWADSCDRLEPGAGRRGDRHHLPGPRSLHLDLLAGETDDEDLLAEAEGGIFAAAASRGQLLPLDGTVILDFPYGRRIAEGRLGEWVGPFRLHGRVGDLLAAATALGSGRRTAGAGWCAKGGQKLPVWATAPALRLEGVEIEV